MLYNLLYPLSAEFSVLNVFRYITFRSVWALLTALIISILVGPMFIRLLQRIRCGQYVSEDVKTHAAKNGTPTMGGLFIGFSLIASVLLWADLRNPHIWITLFVYTGFGAVGFLDDYLKVVRHNNRGLPGRHKLLGQIVVALIALWLLHEVRMDIEKESRALVHFTQLAVPFFKNFVPDLGLFYVPFALLVLVGSSNGVNLTDGLDGLAIGPTIVAGICFAVFIYVAGNVQMSNYLQLPHVPGIGEVTVFCGALVGASLGFLWYNAYPAQVFMGDVGSLSLGGVLGFLAVLCKQELILVVVGGLFVVETISVVVQVGYFKMSGGKRFFRMAPLHHHFELKGIPESKIIIRFWITSILLGMAALSVLKLR